MKIDYILSVSGSSFMPQIDCALNSLNEEQAIVQCKARILTLFKAGYYYFSLFDVKDSSPRLVKTFSVKQSEPEIISSY